MNPDDGNFYEIVKEAEGLIADGATVFQRFTCLACNARQTMAHPDRFYTSGKCQECGYVTDIVANGCGFMLVAGSDPDMQKELVEGISQSMENVQPRNRN